jgi:arylsulfatase
MSQSVFRTGLSKVGLPGAELGMRKQDPTIAALLKAEGHATGQFGKNHPGRPRRAPADQPRLRRVALRF